MRLRPPRLEIVYRNPAELRAHANNPRTHSPEQIQELGRSIRQFSFVSPVLIDRNDVIIAGNGRTAAAKQLGLTSIPTVVADHFSPAQIRAYVIADNRLAEKAGWDRKVLAIELRELAALDFDVTVTGFETGSVDFILGEDRSSADEPADRIPDISRSAPAVSRKGDIWRIGNHLVACGDARDKALFGRLMGSKKAQMVFIDPPYNTRIVGHVSGLGKNRHREFEMASGEMTPQQFIQFLIEAYSRLCEFSAAGSIHYICMDWRHMREQFAAADAVYSALLNICVWAKTNAGMGSFYRSQHELVNVVRNGSAAHINNVQLGRFGRNRSNLWSYAGANAFGKDRDEALAMHPTVKPVALVADAILDASKHGAIVLDSFAGSGTSLAAAEKTGRRGYAIEIDPHYVDGIIRRLEQNFSLKAVLQGEDLDFVAVQHARSTKEIRHGNKTIS